MKKLLGAMLAAALLIPPGLGNAEILNNLKVSGSLDLQTTSGRNITNFVTEQFNQNVNDYIGIAMTRVLVNADWDLLDDVHATVSFRKNDRAWGNDNAGGEGQGPVSNARGTQSQALINGAQAGDVTSNIYLDQAKVKIDKVFGHLDFAFGKTYYGEPGDMVMYFGPTDAYGLANTSLDALTVAYSNDMLDFTGLVGKLDTNTNAAINAGTVAAGDIDLHGAEVWWKLPLRVNTYVWRVVTHNGMTQMGAAGNHNDFLWVYGLKFRGEAAGAWFHLDASFNAGENRTNTNHDRYTGSAYLLKLGYTADMPNFGSLTPWGNFGWGSGRSDSSYEKNDQYTGIAPDYRPGIINRRFDGRYSNLGANTLALGSGLGGAAATNTATNGLANRVVWGMGLNFTPAAEDRLTAGVQFWDFRFQRIDASNGADIVSGAANGFPSIWGAGQSRGNRHIGSELGLTANWNHSENVSLTGGYATFWPGGFIKEWNTNVNALGNHPVKMAFADINIKF